MTSLTLVLGGTRSGKSRFAERLLSRMPGSRIYIATAQAFDAEMRVRIEKHRVRRGPNWTTVEAPLDLVEAVTAAQGPMLIDCLTLWISNLMLAGREIDGEVAALCSALSKKKKPVVVVSNEVGLSVVPGNAMARAFRDAQGLANQQLAAIASKVVFVAAGLPLVLKGSQPRRPSARGGDSARGRRA